MIPSIIVSLSGPIAYLGDTLSCNVVEERNGQYELTLVYPATGPHFSKLAENVIIGAKPNDTSDIQMFRIYKVSSPMNGKITVNAHHISYDLSGYPVSPFFATGIQAALEGLLSHSMITSALLWSVWTDVENTTSTFHPFVTKSIRAYLGGEEGSVLDIFSGPNTGEYEWDNRTIKFWKQRGEKKNIRIEYGKDLTDILKEVSTETWYTGVVAYWANTEAIQYSAIQYVSNHDDYPTEKIFILDATEQFETTPTTAQLNTVAANYRDNNSVGVPKVNIKASFVPLWQSVEYKGKLPIETLSLCDTVEVYYPKLGVDAEMKVIATDYDVLKERYNSITLGDTRSNLASTIQQQIDASIQKSKTKEAIFYLADNQINIAADVVGKYGSNTFNMVDNGLMRPFVKEGPGTSFDLVTLDALDTSTNTVLVITSHNSTSACNTMWIVRRSSGNCFQIGGATGTVTVTCSGNTIHVASSSGNVNAYYVCLDGAN